METFFTVAITIYRGDEREIQYLADSLNDSRVIFSPHWIDAKWFSEGDAADFAEWLRNDCLINAEVRMGLERSVAKDNGKTPGPEMLVRKPLTN